LKLKENFSNLSAKKIKNIHRTINNFGKAKPKISMMTKDSLRKQIIVLIDNNNKSKFIAFSNIHIININSILRNIKSDVMTDFVQTDQYGIIITMNKITSPSDLQIAYQEVLRNLGD